MTTKSPAAESKRALAEIAFVAAAWGQLTRDARHQALTMPSTELPTWAAQERVLAPCMLRYVRRLRFEIANDPSDETQLQHLTDGDLVYSLDDDYLPPREWLIELKRLNSLPSWAIALIDKVDDRYLDIYRRDHLRDDEDLLAPLCADPLHETRAHFMSRAADHFMARQARLDHIAAATGFDPSRLRPSPELDRHMRWLVRFQLAGESISGIAKGLADPSSDRRLMVQKAITDLATLIKLTLRATAKGRPRRFRGK